MFKKGNQINKNRIPWNKGVSHSPEVCKKISEIRKAKGTSKAQMDVLRRMSNGNKGRKRTSEQIQAIKDGLMGHFVSKETREKISVANKGKTSSQKGKTLSKEIREKMSMSQRGRLSPLKGKVRPEISGENHWNWKGGINPVNDSIRKSLDYKNWRSAVFERDGYMCVIGGKEHGNKLHADHIKPFAIYPELRFAIDNGRTLCVECHRKTPTYAGRMLNYEYISSI